MMGVIRLIGICFGDDGMTDILDELEKWIKIMRCCLIVMILVLLAQIILLLLKLGVFQMNESVLISFFVSMVVSLPMALIMVRR